MNITEIPFPEIRERAIEELYKQYPLLKPEYSDINSFTWIETVENHYFWHILYMFLIQEKALCKKNLKHIVEISKLVHENI